MCVCVCVCVYVCVYEFYSLLCNFGVCIVLMKKIIYLLTLIYIITLVRMMCFRGSYAERGTTLAIL